MKKYICTICGFIYDEAAGIPKEGIAPGTKWEQLPEDWVCPLCGSPKSEFEEVKEKQEEAPTQVFADDDGEMRELTIGELSLLCSNLAKGCEKQYLKDEAALFTQLSDYFKQRTPNEDNANTKELLALVEKDLSENIARANSEAGSVSDRGAKRALVWSEKVTKILASLLNRYEKDGEAFLASTNVFVCETCGFIYVGDEAPAICPVCKVPNWKILKVERR